MTDCCQNGSKSFEQVAFMWWLIGTKMSSSDMCKNFSAKWNFNHSWIFNHHFCKIPCQTSKVHGNLKLKLTAQNKKELRVGWAFAHVGPRDRSSWKSP